eukprot:1223458-Pyramimonas_sp.AAC.1
MHPLPAAAFGVVARVQSCVPNELAPPFVRALVRKELKVEAADNAIKNVLWKLQSYVGLGNTREHDLNHPALKEMQELCPESETVLLSSTHGQCPKCEHIDLVIQPGKSRGRIGNKWEERGAASASQDFRFRIYTLGAGVQYCRFREEYCPSCKCYFVGNWMYKKNAGIDGRANFGKMSGMTAVSTQAALPYFVVAQEMAWYAVDLQLLQFITDDLQHSGGTFTSAIHVWAKQHPGREQQNLILGDFMTQTDHTREPALGVLSGLSRRAA